MKYEDLQKIDHTISNKLDHNAFPNYSAMVSFLYKEILASTLTDEEKRTVTNTTRDTVRLFSSCNDTGDTYYESIIQIAQNIGDQLSIALGEEMERESFHTQTIPLSTYEWEELEKMGVKRIHKEGIAYRGGKSRLAAKYMTGAPINPDDHTDDTDLFIDPSLDRLEVIKEFSCDNKGVKYIPSFDEDALIEQLKNTDCTLNQSLLTKDNLIISSACVLSMKTGVIRPSLKSTDLYGRYFYKTSEGPIFSGKTIRRLIKPLTDGRATAIALPKHHFIPANLEKNHLETNILAHIRNYIFKPQNKQLQVYHRLAHILVGMEIIKKIEDIFPYLQDLIENKHPDFSFVNNASPLQQEANRLIKKLIHLTRDVIAEHHNIHKTPLDDGYDMSEKEMTKISVSSDAPDEQFTDGFNSFRNRFSKKIKL